YTTDIPNTHATCHSVTSETPGMSADLAEGTYVWRLRSDCPPFEPQEAQSPPFELRRVPTPTGGVPSDTPPPSATATATATDPIATRIATFVIGRTRIFLPVAAREAGG
ncbi:MAG: hypothetical protein ABI780_15085, partial [Ardenticatenales bacterium]